MAHIEEVERTLHVEEALPVFLAKFLADLASGQHADAAAGQEPQAIGVAALEQQRGPRRGGNDGADGKAFAFPDFAVLRIRLLWRRDLQGGLGDLGAVELDADDFE